MVRSVTARQTSKRLVGVRRWRFVLKTTSTKTLPIIARIPVEKHNDISGWKKCFKQPCREILGCSFIGFFHGYCMSCGSVARACRVHLAQVFPGLCPSFGGVKMVHGVRSVFDCARKIFLKRERARRQSCVRKIRLYALPNKADKYTGWLFCGYLFVTLIKASPVTEKRWKYYMIASSRVVRAALLLHDEICVYHRPKHNSGVYRFVYIMQCLISLQPNVSFNPVTEKDTS